MRHLFLSILSFLGLGLISGGQVRAQVPEISPCDDMASIYPWAGYPTVDSKNPVSRFLESTIVKFTQKIRP